MTAALDLCLAPAPRLSTLRVGREREPVLVFDDMMRDPRALVGFAAGTRFGTDLELGFYPGVRAPAPLDYVEAVARAVSPAIVEAFGLGAVRLARAECSLSILTTPAHALAPQQRIPHVDTSYPLQFALLHYLCGDEFGGTAFYRQRVTGFETVTPEREATYLDAQGEDLAALAQAPAGYITATTSRYEQIGAVAARFDRLAVYRSCLLHSGQIGRPELLNDDPRKGRLTANIFLSYRPA